MKIILPRNEELLQALDQRGDDLCLKAAKELRELYKVRSDYFEQLIEQCDEIDELKRNLNNG